MLAAKEAGAGAKVIEGKSAEIPALPAPPKKARKARKRRDDVGIAVGRDGETPNSLAMSNDGVRISEAARRGTHRGRGARDPHPPARIARFHQGPIPKSPAFFHSGEVA